MRLLCWGLSTRPLSTGQSGLHLKPTSGGWKKLEFPLWADLAWCSPSGAARQVQPSSRPDPGERRTVFLSQLLTSRDRAALAALFTDEAASPDGISQTAYVTPHTNINKFPSLHLLLLMLSLILPSFHQFLSALSAQTRSSIFHLSQRAANAALAQCGNGTITDPGIVTSNPSILLRRPSPPPLPARPPNPQRSGACVA